MFVICDYSNISHEAFQCNPLGELPRGGFSRKATPMVDLAGLRPSSPTASSWRTWERVLSRLSPWTAAYQQAHRWIQAGVVQWIAQLVGLGRIDGQRVVARLEHAADAGSDVMAEISLFGGPYDGRVTVLQDSYEVDGEPRRREGWPLFIEFRSHGGDLRPDQAVTQEETPREGRLLARYRLTDRVTLEGRQVYEHSPE